MSAATWDMVDRRTTALDIGDDRVDADSIKWWLGAIVVLVGAGAAVVKGFWNDRKEMHAKELAAVAKEVERLKDEAMAKLRATEAQIVAERLAAVAEVARVKELAEQKASDRAERNQHFKEVNDQLATITNTLHDFREEFSGKIGNVQHAVDQLQVRVGIVEEAAKADREVLERKRTQLNNLAAALQAQGLKVSFDGESSSAMVAVQVKTRAKPVRRQVP